MRPWLSGIMSPCQGLVGVSITPGRTEAEHCMYNACSVLFTQCSKTVDKWWISG